MVQVTGGGSGTGIAALINGTTDIATSSRPMKDAEKAKRAAAPAAGGRGDPASRSTALAVYVNEKNPLTSSPSSSSRRSTLGEVTNWKEVGGPDAPIILYGRENNSGTYVFFKEHVLDERGLRGRPRRRCRAPPRW